MSSDEHLTWLGLFATVAATPACAPQRAALAPPPLVAASTAHARGIECVHTYGGASKQLKVVPTRDPYTVRAENVQDRFDFKVVYVDEPRDVAGVRIYTYQRGDDAPVLIHEAKYGADYENHGRYGFTGKQLVYDPRGRELEYHCKWLEIP